MRAHRRSPRMVNASSRTLHSQNVTPSMGTLNGSADASWRELGPKRGREGGGAPGGAQAHDDPDAFHDIVIV